MFLLEEWRVETQRNETTITSRTDISSPSELASVETGLFTTNCFTLIGNWRRAKARNHRDKLGGVRMMSGSYYGPVPKGAKKNDFVFCSPDFQSG